MTMMSNDNAFESSTDLAKMTTYQAGILQATAHRNIQSVCDAFLTKYNLTKTHWLIIGIVIDKGQAGMSITRLAKRLDTSLPYLTTTINLLESREILYRLKSQSDKRTKLVGVTDKFAKLVPQIESGLRDELRNTIYKDISREDLQTYMNVLAKLKAL